jgi:hypothetical protein
MLALWFITSAPIHSLADDLFIYPAKNQSAEKQDKDKWECRAWATKQSSFDPAADLKLQLRRRRPRRQEGVCCGVRVVVRHSAQLVAQSLETPEKGRR